MKATTIHIAVLFFALLILSVANAQDTDTYCEDAEQYLEDIAFHTASIASTTGRLIITRDAVHSVRESFKDNTGVYPDDLRDLNLNAFEDIMAKITKDSVQGYACNINPFTRFVCIGIKSCLDTDGCTVDSYITDIEVLRAGFSADIFRKEELLRLEQLIETYQQQWDRSNEAWEQTQREYLVNCRDTVEATTEAASPSVIAPAAGLWDINDNCYPAGTEPRVPAYVYNLTTDGQSFTLENTSDSDVFVGRLHAVLREGSDPPTYEVVENSLIPPILGVQEITITAPDHMVATSDFEMTGCQGQIDFTLNIDPPAAYDVYIADGIDDCLNLASQSVPCSSDEHSHDIIGLGINWGEDSITLTIETQGTSLLDDFNWQAAFNLDFEPLPCCGRAPVYSIGVLNKREATLSIHRPETQILGPVEFFVDTHKITVTASYESLDFTPESAFEILVSINGGRLAAVYRDTLPTYPTSFIEVQPPPR